MSSHPTGSSWIGFSQRLESLPPYIFSELNRIKAEVSARGVSLMSLAIGDPDKPTPDIVVEKLKEVISNPALHGYSPYEGTARFRTAVCAWMQERFGVSVDPHKECTALIGSKEGIAHFPPAFINPGDKCLYPDPGYPVFATAITLAGGQAIAVPLRLEHRFLPDPKDIAEAFSTHKPKFMILNFPGNPTSAVCDKARLAEIVDLARKHQVILVYDNAYSEIYFDKAKRPISILEIPGAKDCAIEFHSFSKTYNMTGWRLGFAVGNAKLVAGLLKYKTNVDSGPFMAVQEVGAFCVENSDKIADPIRQVYRERREAMLAGLEAMKIEYFRPEATFYVWARVPKQQKSMEFCVNLIEQRGLVTTPGVGFGKEGEHFFRLALTVDVPQIKEALGKLASYLK